MYYFIINPKSRSGRGQKVWHTIQNRLDELEVSYNFYFTKQRGHAREIANEICEKIQDKKNIVVLGGDGTINEVINGLKDLSSVCLGYIPSGSSNDFARSLHISSNPLQALDTVLNPPTIKVVDIGEVELVSDFGIITSTHRFAVSCGIGFDATICYQAMSSKIKDVLNILKLGKLTYGIIALIQIIRYQAIGGEVRIDEKSFRRYEKILLIVHMIHRYEGGGAIMAPKANYQDQKLSICFAHNLARFKVFCLLPTAFLGKHTLLHGVDTFDCDTLELKLDQPRYIHTDGEVSCTASHIRACCHKYSLTVCTPS